MGLRQLARTWNSFGLKDPLWAILSHKGKRGNRWDLEEFLQTGRREVAEVLAYAREQHEGLGFRRALDFGCGVGRLSQALAEYFEEVCGVDIAASMLDKARALNRHGERCSYHLNERPDLRLFDEGSFDFVYSNITLQHMKPGLGHGYIAELCRVLSPGGLLIFQLPARPRRLPSLPGRLCTWLLRSGYLLLHRQVLRKPVMDIYATAREEVEELVRAGGCETLDVVQTEAAGPDWISYRYCILRR